jgi:hypothetical protein
MDRNVFCAVPVPALEKFWFWLRFRFREPAQYLAQFSKNKKIVQNLVFKILFPRKLTLLDFVLAPNPNPVPQRQNVAVPVPQH